MSEDLRIHYRDRFVHTDATTDKTAGKDAATRIKTLVYREFNIPLSVPCVLRKNLQNNEHKDYDLTQIIPADDYDLVLLADVLTKPLQSVPFTVHNHPNAFVVTLHPSAELTQDGGKVKLDVSLICTTAVLRHHYLVERFSVKISSPQFDIIEASPMSETQSIVVARTEGTTISLGAALSSSPTGTIGFGYSNTVAVTETVSSWTTGLAQQARSVEWNMTMQQVPHHDPPVQSTNGFTKEFTATLDVTGSTPTQIINITVDVGAVLDSFFLVSDASDVQRGPIVPLHFERHYEVSQQIPLSFNLVPTQVHTSAHTNPPPTGSRPRLDRLQVQFA